MTKGTLPQFPEWRDIESAPRDGTWFLICNAQDGFDSYEVGRFEPLTSPRFEEAGTGDGLYRRVDVQIYDWRGFNNIHCATHWMPLPEPPA